MAPIYVLPASTPFGLWLDNFPHLEVICVSISLNMGSSCDLRDQQECGGSGTAQFADLDFKRPCTLFLSLSLF